MGFYTYFQYQQRKRFVVEYRTGSGSWLKGGTYLNTADARKRARQLIKQNTNVQVRIISRPEGNEVWSRSP